MLPSASSHEARQGEILLAGLPCMGLLPVEGASAAHGSRTEQGKGLSAVVGPRETAAAAGPQLCAPHRILRPARMRLSCKSHALLALAVLLLAASPAASQLTDEEPSNARKVRPGQETAAAAQLRMLPSLPHTS